MNGCSFQQSFTAKFGLVFVLTLENAFSYRFHFIKATEGTEILLKNGTRYFQNSSPFKKSACFCVKISGNFERFQYLNFETGFLESKNLFQKIGVSFFS